jgi:alcohol dehydrogenase/S-(hydroxymethyl)glutathione dehydrogenase/alcohol dehydrogenase
MDSLTALFREVGAPLSIECITLDPPGPTEVLVRNVAVGLCRTDFHVMRGERRVAMRPMVLGHEAAGIVEEAGAAVTAIKPGDHVVLTFIPGCGTCRWCRRGLHHLCAEGRASPRDRSSTAPTGGATAPPPPSGAFCMVGAFAERTVVDQASVVVIDKEIPLDLASLVACGVPAGVGAARHRARVRPGTACLLSAAAGTG